MRRLGNYHAYMILDPALERWGFLDPERAVAFVQSSASDGRQRVSLTSSILRGWAVRNWPRALSLAIAEAEKSPESYPDDDPAEVQRNVLAQLTEQMLHSLTSANQAQDAVDLAQSLDSPEVRQAAYRVLFDSLGAKYPDQMEALYFELPKEMRSDVASTLLARAPWAASTRGADWVTTNVSEKIQPRLYKQLFQRWIPEDASAAAGWLNEHLDSPGIDGAIEAFIDVYQESHPASALQWAELLSSEPVRNQHRAKIGKILGERGEMCFAACSSSLSDPGNRHLEATAE